MKDEVTDSEIRNSVLYRIFSLTVGGGTFNPGEAPKYGCSVLPKSHNWIFSAPRVMQKLLLEEVAERRQRNHYVLLKLMRSTYSLTQNIIPHTTVYPHLVQVQVASGDKLLKQDVNEGPSNGKYASKFSIASMFDAIDT